MQNGLPSYKVFAIELNSTPEHVQAVLESEIQPYLRIAAIVTNSSNLLVIAEARD